MFPAFQLTQARVTTCSVDSRPVEPFNKFVKGDLAYKQELELLHKCGSLGGGGVGSCGNDRQCHDRDVFVKSCYRFRQHLDQQKHPQEMWLLSYS